MQWPDFYGDGIFKIGSRWGNRVNILGDYDKN